MGICLTSDEWSVTYGTIEHKFLPCCQTASFCILRASTIFTISLSIFRRVCVSCIALGSGGSSCFGFGLNFFAGVIPLRLVPLDDMAVRGSERQGEGISYCFFFRENRDFSESLLFNSISPLHSASSSPMSKHALEDLPSLETQPSPAKRTFVPSSSNAEEPPVPFFLGSQQVFIGNPRILYKCLSSLEIFHEKDNLMGQLFSEFTNVCKQGDPEGVLNYENCTISSSFGPFAENEVIPYVQFFWCSSRLLLYRKDETLEKWILRV